MIKNHARRNPLETVSLTPDNARLMQGLSIARFYPGSGTLRVPGTELTHTGLKLQTHNHPTRICAFSGRRPPEAAKIRD